MRIALGKLKRINGVEKVLVCTTRSDWFKRATLIRSSDFEHMIIEKGNRVRTIIPLRACDEELQGVKVMRFLYIVASKSVKIDSLVSEAHECAKNVENILVSEWFSTAVSDRLEFSIK